MLSKTEALVNGRNVELVYLACIAATASRAAASGVSADSSIVARYGQIAFDGDRTPPPSRIPPANLVVEMQGGQDSRVGQTPRLAENIDQRRRIAGLSIAHTNVKTLVVQHTDILV